jgi:replicative DNA helicase
MATPDPIREQSLERSLPNSAEAERAILGGILLDNGLISQAIELLRPEDFDLRSATLDQHRAVRENCARKIDAAAID